MILYGIAVWGLREVWEQLDKFILHFYRNKWDYRIVKPFDLLKWNLLERAGEARGWEKF